jgi:hypothetical protein
MPILSSAARAAVLPATFTGPWAAVLVPALLYVATQRELEVSIRLR